MIITSIEEIEQWFEDDITKKFKKAEKNGKHNRIEKNEAIKETFRKKLSNRLGKKLIESGDNKNIENNSIYYEIRPNEKNRKNHKKGWLYDFILAELYPYDQANRLKKLVLAMEVELEDKIGSIVNDFTKLLQAEADFKIMVFQRKNKIRGGDKGKELVGETFERLEQAVQEYEFNSSTKFLICGWCILKQQFFFREF